MAKAPMMRGFTIAEKRSLQFERIALVVVLLVAGIAMIVSFVALEWIGREINMAPTYAWLIPLMVDGFGVACSVGIIRSQGAGEPGRKRVNEWLGLFYALGLSILGNGFHVIGEVPMWFKLGVASAPPVLLAYGLHVYGRAMQKGISAHVMADDPTHIQMHVTQLGEQDAAAQAARTAKPKARAQAPAPTRAPAPAGDAQPARTELAQPARPAAVADELQAAARALFEESVAANPGAKPDASMIHRAIGSERNPATTRRWVQKWWDEQQEAAEPARDPILEQVGSEKTTTQERATA